MSCKGDNVGAFETLNGFITPEQWDAWSVGHLDPHQQQLQFWGRIAQHAWKMEILEAQIPYAGWPLQGGVDVSWRCPAHNAIDREAFLTQHSEILEECHTFCEG